MIAWTDCAIIITLATPMNTEQMITATISSRWRPRGYVNRLVLLMAQMVAKTITLLTTSIAESINVLESSGNVIPSKNEIPIIYRFFANWYNLIQNSRRTKARSWAALDGLYPINIFQKKIQKMQNIWKNSWNKINDTKSFWGITTEERGRFE